MRFQACISASFQYVAVAPVRETGQRTRRHSCPSVLRPQLLQRRGDGAARKRGGRRNQLGPHQPRGRAMAAHADRDRAARHTRAPRRDDGANTANLTPLTREAEFGGGRRWWRRQLSMAEE
jgi:hypothetical protein